jgi:threonine/homoserine/homoserine lactone efflux protein
VIAPFLAGAAAGYAIAIPVGAIAILILETGIRRGLRPALAAGAGAASADGIYAFVAMAFGAALVGVIAPIERPLRVVSVAVLVAIAARGLRSLRSTPGDVDVVPRTGPSEARGSVARTYLQFLGLTLLNPATVVYFAALILGLPDVGVELDGRLAFVAGAFLSSLSWQSLLAVVGSVGHRRLSPRLRRATSVAGNLAILAFAAIIAAGLLA